jgi:2-polyprenyl-3-methyl-5-hydroxy-6-metoxy-1,4-benzoquinol methylase
LSERDAAGASARETPDLESSTEDYARRFAGPVGAWLLEVQLETTAALLAPWPGATVLDVGGGHGQLAAPLARRGYRVTVVGSAESCRARLEPDASAGTIAFRAADILALPFAERSFDVVVAIRMLAHLEAWPRFVAELCRVASHAVVVDYPDVWSVNALSGALFGMKQAVERNTRRYRCFTRREMQEAFARHGFGEPEWRPQFAWPMALHRALGRAGTASISRGLEGTARALGLTRRWGSPVLVRLRRLESVRAS